MKYLKVSGTKGEVFFQVEKFLKELGLSLIKIDDSRPWGGFFVIDKDYTKLFISLFYPEAEHLLDLSQKMSPKILVVEKGNRLSWQYHYRRSELWKLISGEASIVRSDTDEQTDPSPLHLDEMVTLQCGERHRLIGGNDWGVVAEIWKHTHQSNPSDEDDIVRLQDDFGR